MGVMAIYLQPTFNFRIADDPPSGGRLQGCGWDRAQTHVCLGGGLRYCGQFGDRHLRFFRCHATRVSGGNYRFT